jgi:hypothetical protein
MARVTRRLSPSFICTGERIEHGRERLTSLYHLARERCPHLFVAEETRTFEALYDAVPLGFVDAMRREIAHKLGLPTEIFSLDRFSIHGCGPVGLHDDSFRYPQFYFVMVVAHSGALGLVDERSSARRHQVGEIIFLDPRRKHGLVREGSSAEQHVYESSHSPVYDEERQFLFLDLDVHRSDLQARFRRA